MAKRSAHYVRLLTEGFSSYSPYHGAKLAYIKDTNDQEITNIALVEKIDLERAMTTLYRRGELTKQEVIMLCFVCLDGRLSRRDISALIEEEYGVYVDQRTISHKLESAYWKISRFLGFDYSDGRLFHMVARKLGRPEPYELTDEEIYAVQQEWERI